MSNEKVPMTGRARPMTVEQRTAYLHPCARAIETVQARFAHDDPRGFRLMLTVNK